MDKKKCHCLAGGWVGAGVKNTPEPKFQEIHEMDKYMLLCQFVHEL